MENKKVTIKATFHLKFSPNFSSSRLLEGYT